MDLSLFNLLISTNNTDAANSMPFGISSSMPENQNANLVEGVGKNDAFLKILENAINKADNSSEIVFNTINSRAENCKNAKLIAAGREVTKDTKIVKLSIKRTKPSEMYADKRTLRRIENAQKREVSNTFEEPKAQTEFTTLSDQTVEDTYTLLDSAPVEQNNVEINTSQHVDINNNLLSVNNFNMQDCKQDPTEYYVSESGRIEIKNTDDDLTVFENKPKYIKLDKKEVKIEKLSIISETVVEAVSSQIINNQPSEIKVDNVDDVKFDLSENFKEVKAQDNNEIENVNNNIIDENNVETKETNFDGLENNNKTEIEKVSVKTKDHKVVQELNDTVVDNDVEIDSHFDLTNEESFTQSDTKTRHHQAAVISEVLPDDVNVNIKVQTFGFSKNVSKKEDNEKRDTRVAGVEQKQENVEQDSLFKIVEQKDEPTKVNVKNEEVFKSFDSKVVSNQQSDLNDDFSALVLPTMNNTEKLDNQTTMQAAKNGVSIIGETNDLNTNVVVEGKNNLKTTSNTQKANNTPQPLKQQTYELADQIKVKITKALKSGISRVEVILKPKELGTVKVQIVTKDGITDIHMTASREETMKILSADIQTLKQSLADIGMNMENSTFSFSYAGQFAEKNNQQNQQNNDDKENLARDLHDDKQIAEVSAVEQKATTVLGNHALNIRV